MRPIEIPNEAPPATSLPTGHSNHSLSLNTLPVLIANQSSSTALKKSKKKDGDLINDLRNLFKRLESANDSVNQSSSTDLLGSAVGHGELQKALTLGLKDSH